MSPQTDFIRTTSGRPPAGSELSTWDPSQGLFTPTERRSKRIDRTALCVQITLCIVVAALLLSVIAVPKFRTAATKIDADVTSQTAAGGR